jgi:predicted nucleic acid-binding protein
MTSSAERWACDTSVAVAGLDATHEAHAPCREALIAHRPALAGHAAFETYAVLTRLPPPRRLSATQAGAVVRAAFPEGCWLDPPAVRQLLARLPQLGIVGGSVYDALVAQAALTNERVLLTRDARGERTYRALGVRYEKI